MILTFIIYANSINNEYSLDDNIVVDKKDAIAEKGFKAIPAIFKSRYATDAKQSYDYRPITITSFAIEKQFFKKLPTSQTTEQKKKNDKLTQSNISHFINVLLYALTCIVLFQVLTMLFNDYSILLSLVITIIFVVHPIHTEVVANIKCRDELLMFLFMLLSIKYYIRFGLSKNYVNLGFAILLSLLSILSKKNGFAIFGIIPIVFYYKRFKWKRILIFIGSFVVVFILYKLSKRGMISDQTSEAIREFKFHENPLLVNKGGFMDRLSLGLYCSLFYLKMLIFPFKMSYYYGFSAIPIVTWKTWEVWVSLLIYIPIGIYGVISFLKREVVGLGIILWLGIMLSVINVIMPIVGIVADRFAYSLSLGFCIVVGYLLLKMFKVDLSSGQTSVKLPQSFLIVVSGIILLYSGRTIARNPDWHDYLHTYSVDIDNVPNSAKAHSLIANTLYNRVANDRSNPKNKGYVEDVVYHYKEAIRIDSTYLTCYCNLGSAYIEFLKDYNSGLKYSKIAVEMDPDYLEANYNLATAYDRLNEQENAYNYYLRAIEIDPSSLGVYQSFNELLKKHNLINVGITDLISLAEKSNKPKFIYTNIANLYSLDNSKVAKSVEYFEKAFASDPTDMILCNHLISLFQKFGDVQKANYYRSQYIVPNK